MRDFEKIKSALVRLWTECPAITTIRNIKYFVDRLVRYPLAPIIVAEGDSWFDYDFTARFLEGGGRDLLDHLGGGGRYSIFRMGFAGDTLSNMVHSNQIQSVVKFIEILSPDVFLFSGGGNDFSGQDGVHLEKLLTATGLNDELVQDCISVKSKQHYQTLINAVRSVSTSVPILVHGYAYARPDGRAVGPNQNHPFAGPWLRPAFERKNVPEHLRQDIIIRLIDIFNEMLQELEQQHNKSLLKYVNLRDVLNLSTEHWSNELHPTNLGFKRIAERFHYHLNNFIYTSSCRASL
ncbi:SGNH/GDSL hydrolase family protein [Tautonia rosea]|uniref:SGNH/GDSL hydrolase family protein n=1 Tax=Tautonia rosea TaxID=2728037 RepID=UPI0014754BEF|nr:SGNH/GDSL hydrolase family protein [Tautonia rosea]